MTGPLSYLLYPIVPQLTWQQFLAAITFPVFFYKNVVNVVQLWKASKILVGVDLSERAKAREEGEKAKTSE